MPTLLAFMAHPDDAEILVGGTLLELRRRGWQIGAATMTSGDCGSAAHTRREIAAIRAGEARAAAGMLGAEYACAGLEDVQVFCNAENVRRVVDVMRRFRPDAVVTHSPVDYMVDHEEASRLVRAAAFAIAMPLYETAAPVGVATPALYYADAVEGTDAMGKRILPQFYVDVTDQIESKRTLLACHASQREWLRAHHGIDEYLNRMTAWAEQYGKEAGFGFAEGLRQHLGHGYPHEPLIQTALADRLKGL